MKTIKGTIKGTIEISKKVGKLDLMPYVYIVDNQEPISSISIDNKKDIIKIPRNLKKLETVLKEQNIKITLKDARITKRMATPIQFSKTFSLRDYQKIPVKNIINNLKNTKENSCILKADPGFGKSFILPVIIKELNQKTLIIVDRITLQQQMLEEFQKNTKGQNYQTLSKDTTELKDINITTAQLLLKNKHLIQKAKKEIGLVVVDEMHIISIGAFTEIVNILPSKYRLGLSATPSRSDGYTEAMFDVMGTNIITGFNPNYVGVKFLQIEYPFIQVGQCKSGIEAVMKFYSNPKLLMDIAKASISLTDKGRTVLVYSTYNKAQNELKTIINAMGKSCAIINKDTKAKDKNLLFKQFNDRKIDIIVTGVTTNKGVSIHRLDTIINNSNHTKESLEQLAGRLRREHKNKKSPMFIDFLHKGIGQKNSIIRNDVINTITKNKNKDKKIKWSYNKFAGSLL